MKILALLLFAVCTVRAENFHVLGVKEALGAGDVISIVSLAPGSSGQFLEGRALGEESGKVFLVPGDRGPRSATRWRVLEATPDVFGFQCLGMADGPMWLNGYTAAGRVELALSPHGVSGASWGVYREGTGVNLKCLGSVAGMRWLVGNVANGVALARAPDGAPSLWQIYVWTNGSAVKPAAAK